MYYLGAGAMLAGEPGPALEAWERLYQEEARNRTPRQLPWLLPNLTAALGQRLNEQLVAGDLNGATLTAQKALKLPIQNVAVQEQVVQTLDRAARAAAMCGDWARAAALWGDARDAMIVASGLGSPRPLLHNLALAHEAQDRWLDAAEAWRAMLRTQPRNLSADTTDGPTAAGWSWVRRRVTECYKRAGEPGEAVTVFRQAIKAEPDDLDLRLQLAEALEANDQEQAAINELNRALEIDHRFVEARQRLAELYDARGEWWNSEGMLRKALEQDPEQAEVRRQLAQLLLERGGRQQRAGSSKLAAGAFEEGQRLEPDNYEFPMGLARIAIDERKHKQARELLDRALELGATEPQAWVDALECWIMAEKLPEAEELVARAEAALGPNPDFLIGAAALLLRFCKTTGSRDFLGGASGEPKDTPWYRLAIRLLDRAVETQPASGEIYVRIAREVVKVQSTIALRYAEKAVELLPDDIPALTILGTAQALNDLKDESQKTLRRATRLARERGDTEGVERLWELRRYLENPLFGLMGKLGPSLGDLDFGDLDD